jgi:hypothetical protein
MSSTPQIAMRSCRDEVTRGECSCAHGSIFGARPPCSVRSLLASLACVCWGGLVDAVEIAWRFGLGEAARLSDGPVARGKQGLVWRLDTADGRWAVKVPFGQSGEDEVRSAAAFQEAACAAGVPAPQVRPPPRDACSRPWKARRSGCTSGST